MIESQRRYGTIKDCSALADEIFIKYVNFSFKLIVSSLLTSRGGMLGTFFPFHKVLSVSQYDFMDLERSHSFFPRRI